ncbi:MAG: RdgB/HAM1 family non-canonical purine NTP pyrophosphatase [Actinomycetota bacterium]|nr:RdgB/HAM1 family non-canonical purine NTP pyrophosphatase [Actinomycetota bacterium]
MTTAFVLSSANPDKAREITEILGDRFALTPRPPHIPDVEETGLTLEDNARLKAVALVEATGIPAVADDTGLEVDALDGAPGVRSARYAGEDASYADNVAKLLTALGEVVGPHARRARFRTVAIAVWPGGREVLAEGTVAGWIADEPRGDGGFGYDPVFIAEETGGATFAEVDSQTKHAVSHRGRAFRALAALIGE